MKESNVEKFFAALFLRNSNYVRYNDLMIKHRKAYANNTNQYPANLLKMMDVMR